MGKTLTKTRTATSVRNGVTRDAQMESMRELLQRGTPGEEAFPIEQMLGEPIPLGAAWPGAFYQSPKMRHVKALLIGMNSLEQIVPESVDQIVALLDGFSDLAQQLIRLPVNHIEPEHETAWRSPTLDEIQERFDLEEIKALLMAMLRKDKFLAEETSRGNA